MNVNAISSTLYNRNTKLRKTNSVNFKNQVHLHLNEISADKKQQLLDMLRESISCVMSKSNAEELLFFIDHLKNKWKTTSAGLMIVPPEKLKSFFEGKVKIKEKDLENSVGICISVGDKYGPIETWNKAYETIVALIPKEESKVVYKAIVPSIPKVSIASGKHYIN